MDIQKDDTQNKNIELSKTTDQPTTATVDPIKKNRPIIHRPPTHAYGRIGKTNPDIKRSIHDIQMSEGHLAHDIERLESDKAGLTEQVRILEKQLDEAKKAGLSKSTTKRLETLIEEARDRSQTLSKIIPDKSFSRDHAMMEELIKKWREYDHLRTHQAAAEHRFNLNPEDKHAEGDVNRSRATAFALHQEISDLVKKSEKSVPSDKIDDAPEESVLYTHEEASADKEAHEKAPEIEIIATANEAVVQHPEPLVNEKIAEIFNARPSMEITDKGNLQPKSPHLDTQDLRASAIPVESLPSNNPQAFAYAKKQVQKHLDLLFGFKGFLGIGKNQEAPLPIGMTSLMDSAKK